MEVKKSERADLQGKKSIFAQVGLIASLLAVWGLFSIHQGNIEIELPPIEEETVLMELAPVTRPEEPAKPRVQKVVAPSLTEKIEVVDNEVEIEETDIFNPEIDEFTPNYAGLPEGIPNDGDLLMEETAPIYKAEVNPSFQGDNSSNYAAFSKWVHSQVVFPEIVQESGIQGSVVIRFVIQTDGTLGQFEILASPDSMLSDEVIRVFKKSPKWEPGLQRQRPVPVIAVQTIKFQF